MTLEETQFVEVNHHLLQEKVNQYAVPGDLVATARNLFHFVRDNIGYQDYSDTRKGAVRTLQEGCEIVVIKHICLLVYFVLVKFQPFMLMVINIGGQ